MNRKKIILFVVVACVIEAIIGFGLCRFFLFPRSVQSALCPAPVRESSMQYGSQATLSDPLITIRPASPNSPEYAALQDQVQSYINSQTENGLSSASVQFRDINTVTGFVINPTEKYYPASLYKVFLMITYFRIAGENPDILNKKIYYEGTHDYNAPEEIKPSVDLVPNTYYTVEQLIEHMIRYSDNNALRALTDNLTNEQTHIYQQVFGDLNINPSTVDQQVNTLTVGGYGTVLSALYNASYLDRRYSERALELLTQSDFTEGIASGVPNTSELAQKFGEAQIEVNGAIVGKQLSNCGIIYYPHHPYRLCVMTKGAGDHIKFLEGVLADISRIVYKDVEKRYP
ncbi:MAG: hypothetical protein JWO50_349 [Candidatus Kaiserbacteria bacterium]|nr:hypothetical protein [Candidatus Kaiserbacteria bacterium]